MIELNKIYNEDCLETMARMGDGSVDLIFTSPPFKDEDVPDEYWEWYGLRFDEMLRVSKNAVILLHSATKLNELITRYPPRRTLIWGKGTSQYTWRWNPILVYQKGEHYKVNKYIWSDTFGVPSLLGGWKWHKYQDPYILYESILSMFKNNATVYDPFVGSGTTVKVAQKLGLSWLGSEIDNECYNFCLRRLGELTTTAHK